MYKGSGGCLVTKYQLIRYCVRCDRRTGRGGKEEKCFASRLHNHTAIAGPSRADSDRYGTHFSRAAEELPERL